MPVCQPLDTGRQTQHFEGRDALRYDAERERDMSALPEGVDAEPGEVAVLERDVEVTGLLEGFEALGRALPHYLDQRVHVLVHQNRVLLERAERAVAPEDRREADLQVDVAGTEFNGASEQGIELHGGLPWASACLSRRFRPWMCGHCVPGG